MSHPPNVSKIQDAAIVGVPTVISVTFLAEPSPDGMLEIDPQEAYVSPGATVLWKLSGVPEGYVPLIHFESGAPGTFDPGPFTALCLNTGGVTGAVAPGVSGDWPYQVLLHPVPGFGSETHAPGLPPAKIMIPEDPRDGQDT